MALSKDIRLKQMMVYRLEEQLSVVHSDDNIYSRILASLSRCVQSLLVPKKEKGCDGSGDATTVDPFVNLDELLLNAPRGGNDQLPRDTLLVLLADSLSVVFSTFDELKPGPVSSTYLKRIVDEELAKEKSLNPRGTSNASNANAQFTESTVTDVHSDTVSGVNSYAYTPAPSPAFTAPTSTDQKWSQEQHTPAAIQSGENIGNQPFNQQPSFGFFSQGTGFGSESHSAPFSADSRNQSEFGGTPGAQPGSTFGAGSQSYTVASGGPSSTQLPQSQTGFSSGGVHSNVNRASPLLMVNASQQSAPSFDTPARKMPVQEPVVGISFGTRSKEVPSQPTQFNKPADSFDQQQPAPMQQQQFQSLQSSEFGTHQQTSHHQPGFGIQTVQEQFNQAPVLQPTVTPTFGTQPNTLLSAQPQSMQQAAPSFGTQSHVQQQFNQAPVQKPSETPAFGIQSNALPAVYNQQFQVPDNQQPAPIFGAQQQSAPMQQQSAPMQQYFQANAAANFGSFTPLPPQTESSSVTTSSMNVTASSEMISTTETDGGSVAMADRVPVKKPAEIPDLTFDPNQPELKWYDWSDYNPGPSNFGKHIIPESRGGYGGGGRGGGGFRGGAPRGGGPPRGGYGGRGRGQ